MMSLRLVHSPSFKFFFVILLTQLILAEQVHDPGVSAISLFEKVQRARRSESTTGGIADGSANSPEKSSSEETNTTATHKSTMINSTKTKKRSTEEKENSFDQALEDLLFPSEEDKPTSTINTTTPTFETSSSSPTFLHRVMLNKGIMSIPVKNEGDNDDSQEKEDEQESIKSANTTTDSSEESNSGKDETVVIVREIDIVLLPPRPPAVLIIERINTTPGGQETENDGDSSETTTLGSLSSMNSQTETNETHNAFNGTPAQDNEQSELVSTGHLQEQQQDMSLFPWFINHSKNVDNQERENGDEGKTTASLTLTTSLTNEGDEEESDEINNGEPNTTTDTTNNKIKQQQITSSMPEHDRHDRLNLPGESTTTQKTFSFVSEGERRRKRETIFNTLTNNKTEDNMNSANPDDMDSQSAELLIEDDADLNNSTENNGPKNETTVHIFLEILQIVPIQNNSSSNNSTEDNSESTEIRKNSSSLSNQHSFAQGEKMDDELDSSNSSLNEQQQSTPASNGLPISMGSSNKNRTRVARSTDGNSSSHAKPILQPQTDGMSKGEKVTSGSPKKNFEAPPLLVNHQTHPSNFSRT